MAAARRQRWTRRIAAAVVATACPLLISAATSPARLQVRLLTPLASYSAPGTPFQAQVIAPQLARRTALLPDGTLLVGSVREAHSLGLGLKRERATLALDFEHCQLPSGEMLACTVQLLSVDNARETVAAGSRIEGVLAASHPHSWLSGVWYRPTSTLLHRSAAGLTGAGGMLQSKLAPTLPGAALVVASRLILFRMPDSEIELPRGTELNVLVTANSGQAEEAEESGLTEVSGGHADWLRQQSPEVTRADPRKSASDILNIALQGSREQIIQAFQAAGWVEPEPLTGRTMRKTYAAFAGMRNYATAPVSPLLYQGRLPDLVFLKSFNSLAKRHHIRLWQVERPDGTAVWLGAATHDTAITLDWSHVNLTHRIDPRVDRERNKVIADLAGAGCLADLGILARASQVRLASDAGDAITDGAMLVANLQPCATPEAAATDGTQVLTRPHHAMLALATRRFVLEMRQYLTRGNAYYLGYRAVRWSILRSRPAPQSETY